jgi:hypothetical protein
MTDKPRTALPTARPPGPGLRSARANIEFAELAAAERDRPEMPAVAAGLAVLAGIAAADAICALRLQQIHRRPDHRGATELLETATPDGTKLANTLRRLLDLKDAAHYGIDVVAAARARRSQVGPTADRPSNRGTRALKQAEQCRTSPTC